MAKKSENEFTVAEAINLFLKESNLQDMALIKGIIGEWANYVGKPIASHTDKVSFNNRVLFVSITHPTWKTEFSYMRESLRRHINEKANWELVKEITLI